MGGGSDGVQMCEHPRVGTGQSGFEVGHVVPRQKARTGGCARRWAGPGNSAYSLPRPADAGGESVDPSALPTEEGGEWDVPRGSVHIRS